MHLIMAPAVIAGLVAKLRTRKLEKSLVNDDKKPELALVIQSIQDKIKTSRGTSVEEKSQATSIAG